jgi:hypothetical protein
MSTLGLSVAAAQGRPCGEITRVIFRLSAAKLRTQRRYSRMSFPNDWSFFGD